MLLNKLFTINQQRSSENKLETDITLNASHFVYKAHFPENPVTPGVYILQMAKEILEKHLACSLTMVEAKNVKFLNILSPTNNANSTFSITWKKADNLYEASIIVANENSTFVKISTVYN
jgi:3-hydroxyacyl-[acyl-carrier-protein] dehydratase